MTHSGYKYTRRSWWTRERGTRQTDKTGPGQRPTTCQDLFHSGLSEWQCPPLVRSNTTSSTEDVHRVGGEEVEGMWQWCHSGRLRSDMFVMVANWKGGCLGYSEAPGCKKTRFFWLGGPCDGGGEWGMRGNNLFTAVADSHLSQVSQRKSCGSCAVERRWSSVCQTSVFYSKEWMFTVYLLFNRFPVNANIIQLPIFLNDLVIQRCCKTFRCLNPPPL